MTRAMPDHTLIKEAHARADGIVALRRAIHAEPELGLMTPKTSAKVRAALAHLPLEWREGPSTSGMVAVLKGGARPEENARRSVLLRGDMDALLAGAAEVLCARAASLKGDVLFMFQPGEEGFHGARFMLDDGLLDPLPDAAFALHVMPNAPHGLVGGRAGPLLAAADMIEIVVEGKGGHASLPHQTQDPVPVACEIVTALQTLVTRQFSAHDPVVLTIASISAGTTHNVIPDRAVLKGTMRTLSAEHRARLADAVRLLAAGIAGAHGLTADVTVEEGFPVTVCDPRAVTFGEETTHAMFGQQAFRRLPDPIMGAEDFAYVLDKVPGAMFFLGFAPEGDNWANCCGIHSTRMMLDEAVLPQGAALLAGLAERFLETGFGA